MVRTSDELFVRSTVHACFARPRRVIPAVPLRHESVGIERALPFCHHHFFAPWPSKSKWTNDSNANFNPSNFASGGRLHLVHLPEDGQQCSSVVHQHWHVRAVHIADDPMRNFLE